MCLLKMKKEKKGGGGNVLYNCDFKVRYFYMCVGGTRRGNFCTE